MPQSITSTPPESKPEISEFFIELLLNLPSIATTNLLSLLALYARAIPIANAAFSSKSSGYIPLISYALKIFSFKLLCS